MVETIEPSPPFSEGGWVRDLTVVDHFTKVSVTVYENGGLAAMHTYTAPITIEFQDNVVLWSLDESAPNDSPDNGRFMRDLLGSYRIAVDEIEGPIHVVVGRDNQTLLLQTSPTPAFPWQNLLASVLPLVAGLMLFMAAWASAREHARRRLEASDGAAPLEDTPPVQGVVSLQKPDVPTPLPDVPISKKNATKTTRWPRFDATRLAPYGVLVGVVVLGASMFHSVASWPQKVPTGAVQMDLVPPQHLSSLIPTPIKLPPSDAYPFERSIDVAEVNVSSTDVMLSIRPLEENAASQDQVVFELQTRPQSQAFTPGLGRAVG